MRRRLFNLAAAVSLLLCCGSALAWITGCDTLRHFRSMHAAGPHVGGIAYPYPPQLQKDLAAWRARFADVDRSALGFRWRKHFWQSWPLNIGGITLWGYTVEFRFPVKGLTAVFALMPGLWLLTRPRTLRPGYCNCGYNLTGNTSGVCPECGTPVAEKVEVSS